MPNNSGTTCTGALGLRAVRVVGSVTHGLWWVRVMGWSSTATTLMTAAGCGGGWSGKRADLPPHGSGISPPAAGRKRILCGPGITTRPWPGPILAFFRKVGRPPSLISHIYCTSIYYIYNIYNYTYTCITHRFWCQGVFRMPQDPRKWLGGFWGISERIHQMAWHGTTKQPQN